MSVAVLTIAFDSDLKLFRGCVESFRGMVDNHLFLLSAKTWNGDHYSTLAPDQIAKEYNVDVLYKAWATEEEQRNDGMKHLAKYDHVIIQDVDEWYTKQDAKTLVGFVSSHDHAAVDIRSTTYFGDANHILIGDTHRPLVSLKSGESFTNHRNSKHTPTTISNCTTHHLSWVKYKDILTKVTGYSHAPDFDGSRWYENVFLQWKDGAICMPDGKWFNTEVSPLPMELKPYLIEGSI